MRNVHALFDTYADAKDAVHALESAGFPSSDISIVANNADSSYDRDEVDTDAAEGAGAGAGVGAVLGGAGGLLAGSGSDMSLIVDIFEARSDNYGYLAHDSATGRTAAIDAPEEGPILKALERRGWRLSDIFITHHHPDHVEAIPALKKAFNARVTGPQAEAQKIDGLDILVKEGDKVMLGQTAFHIIETPGHTLGHIVYHDAANRHVFTGDALFSLGVGRMFEGTPGPMWQGLLKLRALHDETLMYCGHEYSAANARFALHLDPGNIVLQIRAAEINKLREKKQFTIPMSMGVEKLLNPFLRADDPVIARALGLEGADGETVFAALRKAKDVF